MLTPPRCCLLSSSKFTKAPRRLDTYLLHLENNTGRCPTHVTPAVKRTSFVRAGNARLALLHHPTPTLTAPTYARTSTSGGLHPVPPERQWRVHPFGCWVRVACITWPGSAGALLLFRGGVQSHVEHMFKVVYYHGTQLRPTSTICRKRGCCNRHVTRGRHETQPDRLHTALHASAVTTWPSE